MALFIMIFRRMYKHKWLQLSLLLGLTLTVAMTSTLPIYKNAILQKMLVKDLENFQTISKQFPGGIWSSNYLPPSSPLERKQQLIPYTLDSRRNITILYKKTT